MPHQIAEVGGVFALLVLIHFISDWGFQSHDTATLKPVNRKPGQSIVSITPFHFHMSFVLLPGRVGYTISRSLI
jgi:hypothetical protein